MQYITFISLALSAALFAATTVHGQKAPPPFRKMVFADDGRALPYGLLEPSSRVEGKRYPLVIFLHGAGERGDDNEKNWKHIQILFTANTLNKWPCFVIAPQCPKGEVWSDMMWGKPFSATPTAPMKSVIALIDKVLAELPVEPSQIYVTGVSMGGYGTWDLLARFPHRFAGAVPVCGGADPAIAERVSHVPVWVFHGAVDETVPPERSRRMVAALQAEGALPGYTEYPGVAHSSWHQAYKEPMLMTWLFRQRLATPQN